ncbi:hypothetical protein ABPG72_015164 [Tetrahymena utriculariae]
MDNINKKNQAISNQISITSYNILADLYTDPWYFPYCPKQYLNFDYRKWKIVEEIKLINSDIVCLQETDHIEDFYYQQFQELGYQIQYALKPYRTEGILIMFKKDKFKMISEHAISFDNEIPDTFNKKHYQRNNNALIIQLKNLNSDLKIVIANTHLFWNPQNEEVKLLQTAQLLQYLTKNYKEDENIVLCGDFNSMPSSNVIKYITDKKEPHLSRVEKQFSKYVLIKDMMAIHNMFSEMNLINLKSSYDDYLEAGKHPQFTNYTKNFKGTLDYIFYNPNMKQLQWSNVRQIPVDLIKKEQGLPSQHYPSDHLPITSIFDIVQDGQDQNTNKNNQVLSDQISITSYNILADTHTDPSYYPYCPKQYLNFDYRKWKIVEEIKLINSDIVCLQEVDHIEDFYYYQFQDLGYQIQYALKPYRTEGALIMFKKDKFKLISEHAISFDNEIPDTFNKKHYQRNNNALIIQLKNLNSDLKIVIANTHLFWNPQNEEILLLQTAQLLKQLSKNYNKDENIILCGDFNSLPNTNVVKYITDKKEPDLSRVEQQFQNNVLIKDMMAIHNMFSEMNLINLKSSYDNYLKTGKHPEFTNYTQNFKGTLDYIFYNPNMKQIQLSDIKEIPIDLIKKEQGLPSQHYPSDHLPITTIFSLVQDVQDQNTNKNNQVLSNQISITSYDILSDLYTDPSYYPYCPKQYLNFDYRKWKIVEEIKIINSDIVCLQEVDHIEDFYYYQFQDLGYQIQYALQPYKTEGILVMFKKDKFKMIYEHFVDFNYEIPDTFNKTHYQRNNKALIIQLKHLNSDLKIVIANTHLFWDSQNEEILLLQTAQLLKYLTQNYKEDENIILCGDFNSMPSSNIIKYITDKKELQLSRVEQQLQNNVFIKDMMAIHNMFSQMNLINLKSSYDDYLKTRKHPEFTNYTQDFKGTLDYIFYNPNMKQFQLSDIREIPIDLIKKEQGLPSQHYPSDHLPITTIFSIVQGGQDQNMNLE